MPVATLRLRRNPDTRELELVLDYDSDQDALPFEHEEEHRSLLKQLLTDDVSDIRRAPAGAADDKPLESQAEPVKTALKLK